MTRLLCIIGNMNAGGAETYLMKLYRTLDRSRYQMDFCINVTEKCFYEDEILNLGGKIHRIPAKSENLKAFRRQLRQLVAREGYTHVLRITSSAMGFMDLKIARQGGARVCIARSSNSSDGGSWKSLAAHRLGRLLYGRYVDVKIAPSDLAARYTFGEKAYRSQQVAIVHNGVDVDFFRYDPQARMQIRQELGIPAQAKLLGHIGRFMAQKNHLFLVDVFAACHRQDPDARLLLVGAGELENQVREKIRQLGLEDRVIFTGVRSDVPALLSAMDVFVFPSLYEGMPNTVIEAQANGLPCLIADTITAEADITGLVSYLPLTEGPEVWARKIASTDGVRQDQKAAFERNRYDIGSVAADFVSLVFQE